MIVFRTPYCGYTHSNYYNNASSCSSNGSFPSGINASAAAINVFTSLPQQVHRKSLSQIKVVDKNITAARCLESDHGESTCGSLSIKASNEELQKRVADLAYRRIQLYYYLLVAYHEEGCSPHKAKPKLQHGKTSNPKCCAVVYPSLFPRAKDTFFSLLAQKIKSNEIDSRTQQLMDSLKISLVSTSGSKLMDVVGTTKSLISKESDFYHNLQQTIELPILVGDYNNIIEEAAEKIGGELLEACSNGTIEPYEATRRFVNNMSRYLKKSLVETENKIKTYTRCLELIKSIQTMEEDVLQDNTIDSVQYCLANFELLDLMHLIQESKVSLQAGFDIAASLHARKEFYLWIVNYLRKDMEYCSKITNPTEFEKFYVRASCKLDAKQEVASELVNLPMKPLSFEEQKESLMKRFLACDIVTYCFADGKRRSEFPKLLADQLRQAQPLSRGCGPEEIKSLEQTIVIIEWMMKANLLPNKKYLSGIVKNGDLLDMSKDELFKQKLEIIARNP